MNGSVICIFQIHALFQAFLGEKLLSHATPNRHHTISPIKNELSSLHGSIYSILYTKPCSINGDNVYRGINTAVGISNACSRSFRLVPATNVFLRSCTRIRYIRPPIRGGITRCLRSIRTERERERERENGDIERKAAAFFFLPFFLSSSILHPILVSIPTARGAISQDFISRSTRGWHSKHAGGGGGGGERGMWKCMENGRGSCEEALCLRRNDHRWTVEDEATMKLGIYIYIYKTHERETHERTLIATGRNATRGWLIARVGIVWTTFRVTYWRYSFDVSRVNGIGSLWSSFRSINKK